MKASARGWTPKAELFGWAPHLLVEEVARLVRVVVHDVVGEVLLLEPELLEDRIDVASNEAFEVNGSVFSLSDAETRVTIVVTWAECGPALTASADSFEFAEHGAQPIPMRFRFRCL